MNHWHILGIPPTRDEAAIKRAYAQKLKQHRPDRDPQGFIALRAAYEEALAYSAGEAAPVYNRPADDAPLLDPRHISRSWRKAKSDDALLALFQEQNRLLPTIDEQLDYRDILSSWIEARDRPRRYPKSLIWAVDRYRLLHGLDPDDPLRADYLRALIICGERDKALTALAMRYPALTRWLQSTYWQRTLIGMHEMLAHELAELQRELDLDDDAIRATFPTAAPLLPNLRPPDFGLAAAAALAWWLEWRQTAISLSIICAYIPLYHAQLRVTRGGANLPFIAPAPLCAGVFACYAVLGIYAPAAWHLPVATLGVLAAVLAYSRIPADDIQRRHYLFGGIILGIPLNLTSTNPLFALYWLIPCLAAAANRYRDYDLNFLRFFANTAYVAAFIQTGWQLWLLRDSNPFPAIVTAAGILTTSLYSLHAMGAWQVEEEETPV